jgi:hypothetical protein
MNLLHDFQNAFTDWVLRSGSKNQLSAFIRENGLTVEQRLNVYQNNTQLGLTGALRDGFPVVNKLVGTEFFNQLARCYLRHYPPKAGCLLFFGSEFADFISDYDPASSLPYLPDIARLEWFWHEAFHEADAGALDVKALAGISPDCYGSLGFSLHPTVRLLASSYPIQHIWQINQEGFQGDGTVNLEEGACRVLVFRPELEVLLMTLTEAEFDFLSSLVKGLTLNQAVDAALIIDNQFNLSSVFQRWFANGLFTDYFIKPIG